MIYEIIIIKAMLEEIKNEEDDCNEGSLGKYYEEIIKKLDNIKENLYYFSRDCFISKD